MKNLVNQSGAALILVLMVVAIISSVGVFSSNNLISLSKFSQDLTNRQQALWYAIGVESTASNFLEQRIKEKNKSKIIADSDLPVIKVSLEKTNIEGSLKDLNACLNVNSLVKKEEKRENFVLNQGGVDQYKNLLKALSFNDLEMEGLVYSLVDWLDSDVYYSNAFGAEDDYYIRKDYSYRAANQPISSLSEMNSIKDYSLEVMKVLSPYLCVLPLVGDTGINVNAIPEERPALLVMLFGEKLSIKGARNILLNRPEGGFLDLEEFWSHPELKDIVVSKLTKSQFQITSYFYLLETKILAKTYPYYMESVLNLDSTGSIKVLQRRLGTF